MATLKTVLHPKSNANNTKIYRLALRVTVDRKRSYLYLGHNIDLKDWDDSGKVKKSHKKHILINRLIRKKYDEIEDIIFESDSLRKKLTARQIIDAVKGRKEHTSFFDIGNEHIEDLKKIGQYNRAISDNSKINSFKEFVKNSDLSFQEIDENLLKKYRVYSLAKGSMSERSIVNVYILIRLLYNRAIKRNIVEQKYYPFGADKVKIKLPESEKIGLNEEELKAIENLELEKGATIWHARNVFLFSFYLAGIRISDTLKMKWSDVKDDRLYYQMGKNKKRTSLKLHDKIIEILLEYKHDKKTDNDFIFPELKKANLKDPKDVYTKIKTATKKLNANLGKIAKLAEIDKKITSHIARHTFGNIAGDKISPQMLQKLYRHSNLTTTIGYQGNFIHKNADEALDSVINF